MKKEDLIKKLENITAPKLNIHDFRIENHKQSLKSSLLASEYSVSFKDLLQEFNQSKIMFWTKRLSPAGLAFVLVFVLGLGMIQTKSQIVRAMEIAQNDPQIVEIMEEYGVDVRDVRLIDNKPYILLGTIEEELMSESVRLTPDSRLYFLKRLSEGLGTLFTFGDEAKAKRYTQLANRRLVEAKMMADEDRIEAVEKALLRYEAQLGKSLERAEQARTKGKDVDDVTEVLARATGWHLLVLDDVLERVPEQAKEAIIKAREVSATGQVEALKALVVNNPEKAVEINLKVTEAKLNRVRTRVIEGEVIEKDLDEAIRSHENRSRINEEIIQIAQDSGRDTAKAEQLLERATNRHLETLAEIYERAPEEAKMGIERAIESSTRERERIMERIIEMSGDDALPIEAQVRTREMVQEENRNDIDSGNFGETGSRKGRTEIPELPIVPGR